MGPITVHIVVYTCERCAARQSRATGVHNDGLCALCGDPMRIDELFEDRRVARLPVPIERRDSPGAQAA